MVFLANSDLLAMVLVLWTMLPTTSLPLTPAAQFLLDLLRAAYRHDPQGRQIFH